VGGDKVRVRGCCRGGRCRRGREVLLCLGSSSYNDICGFSLSGIQEEENPRKFAGCASSGPDSFLAFLPRHLPVSLPCLTVHLLLHVLIMAVWLLVMTSIYDF
jgi:hypothetical protein